MGLGSIQTRTVLIPLESHWVHACHDESFSYSMNGLLASYYDITGVGTKELLQMKFKQLTAVVYKL